MDERLQRLQAAITKGQIAFNQRSIGIRTVIMIERDGRKPGQRIGKTPWMQSVHVDTDAAVGAFVDVEIVSAGPNSLGGVIPAHAGTSGRASAKFDTATHFAEIPAYAGMTV